MNRKLSSELQEMAISNLNEVPNRIKEDVEKIREWLQKQQHLPVKIDDDRLLAFLRGSKYSLQKTKEKIDYYFTLRTLTPEFYYTRDPLSPQIQAIINAGCLLPLPKPDTKTGAKIIIWYMNNSNPQTTPYLNLILVNFMVLDILMKECDNAVICGLKVLLELTNCSAKYITQISPGLLKKHLDSYVKGFPIRIKGFYVTNCPSYLEYACNLIKSLTKNKVAQRMTMHSDIADLYDEIPQILLPKELGGENGSVEAIRVEWKQKIESYREWFLENKNYKSDESLRSGSPRTLETTFGIEGSFRKLDLD
ncbi:hypothetical protein FQA39_LY15923 [Lamprigera yunnana]|nr:hypothetical protein FQA39_LY15923 [Lamprigera yunnana]